MLLVASVLAYCAPDDLQQRALAGTPSTQTHCSNGHAGGGTNSSEFPATKAVAAKAKPLADTLASILDGAGGVRDYLSAKRQSVAGMRADDIEATLLLWAAVNAPTVQALGEAAIKLYDTLNSSNGSQPSIVQLLDLRDTTPSTMPPPCPLGTRTTGISPNRSRSSAIHATRGARRESRPTRSQINNVAGHLDTLLRIAPLVVRGDVLPQLRDWLVRSAIIVELNALLDLAVGAPGRGNVMYCLLDVCRRGRAQEAADLLERLRDSIGVEGWG